MVMPNTPPLTLRTSQRSGDYEAILRMHQALYDYGPEFDRYVADTLRTFYASYNPERECVWLAQDGDKVVGSIVLKETEGWAQLRYFLIQPEYRGRGLGKLMMEAFTAFRDAAGYTKSFLLTEEQLETAAALYEKHGYQFVSHTPMDFGLVELRYEWHHG